MDEFTDGPRGHEEKGIGGNPSIVFDAAKYRSHLEGFDLTDEQAAEFLAALWDIMCTFAWHNVKFDVAGYFSLLAKAAAAETPPDESE